MDGRDRFSCINNDNTHVEESVATICKSKQARIGKDINIQTVRHSDNTIRVPAVKTSSSCETLDAPQPGKTHQNFGFTSSDMTILL
jgi:hypothetical protein